jgi:hypothetical protein
MTNLAHDLELDRAAPSQPLAGDAFIRDARAVVTHGITIDATPAEIWPHLLDMVREEAADSYTLLLREPPNALVLGALYDARARTYLAFDGARPDHFWHATWALVLDRITANRTRLSVRARVAATSDVVRWSAIWLHPFHDFMDANHLRRLKDRAERRSERARAPHTRP